MDRPVRRKDREISVEEATQLMVSASYGVLATVSGDGRPYAVPVHFVFHDRSIYFHCATDGQKLDHIRANPSVSFCVVGETRTLPDQFSTNYESAIAFGRAEEIRGDEKKALLPKIVEKYSPAFLAEGARYIEARLDKTVVVKITIDRLTGKARR